MSFVDVATLLLGARARALAYQPPDGEFRIQIIVTRAPRKQAGNEIERGDRTLFVGYRFRSKYFRVFCSGGAIRLADIFLSNPSCEDPNPN